MDTSMADETRTYTVQLGRREVSMSCRLRGGSEDLILALHGFGCSREAFDGLFSCDSIRPFSICALDFPSHGNSSPMDPEVSTLENYGVCVRRVLERLSFRRLIVVGHSMGGAVGVLAAGDLPALVAFINVEGNLVSEDCG